MRWILIRHGKTRGNLEGRYIGCRTDELLCPEGIEELRKLSCPKADWVYVSPMRRCIETAEILYPGVPMEIVPDFRECDFGDFEGKNYAELNGRADYQAWIDSGGELPFPGGESRVKLSTRCVKAFAELQQKTPRDECALIVHGGTIMAIMEIFSKPRSNFYDYQVKNGCGYILEEDGSFTPIG